MDFDQRKLKLVRGNAKEEVEVGPVTRLNLRERFPLVDNTQWLIFLSAKLILVGAMAYYFFTK
jgi:hypothetical protein